MFDNFSGTISGGGWGITFGSGSSQVYYPLPSGTQINTTSQAGLGMSGDSQQLLMLVLIVAAAWLVSKG